MEQSFFSTSGKKKRKETKRKEENEVKKGRER